MDMTQHIHRIERIELRDVQQRTDQQGDTYYTRALEIHGGTGTIRFTLFADKRDALAFCTVND